MRQNAEKAFAIGDVLGVPARPAPAGLPHRGLHRRPRQRRNQPIMRICFGTLCLPRRPAIAASYKTPSRNQSVVAPRNADIGPLLQKSYTFRPGGCSSGIGRAAISSATGSVGDDIAIGLHWARAPPRRSSRRGSIGSSPPPRAAGGRATSKLRSARERAARLLPAEPDARRVRRELAAGAITNRPA